MDQHYAPVFLLKRWTDPNTDSKVGVFNNLHGRVRYNRYRPKHTGFEVDTYSLSMDEVAGMSKHDVETIVFQSIDDHAAKLLEKIEADDIDGLDQQARSHWIRFILSMKLRQPHKIEWLKKEAKRGLVESLDEQPDEYSNIAEKIDPPTLRQWVDENFEGLIDNVGLSWIGDFVQEPNSVQALSQMRWFKLDLEGASEMLLLSDDPCSMVPSLAHPHAVVAMPIGPKKAFIAVKSAESLRRIRESSPQSIAQMLNSDAVWNSRKRVFAFDDTAKDFVTTKLHERLQRRD